MSPPLLEYYVCGHTISHHGATESGNNDLYFTHACPLCSPLHINNRYMQNLLQGDEDVLVPWVQENGNIVMISRQVARRADEGWKPDYLPTTPRDTSAEALGSGTSESPVKEKVKGLKSVVEGKTEEPKWQGMKLRSRQL